MRLYLPPMQLVSVIREEIMEEQRGRHGHGGSQTRVSVDTGREADSGGGEAAIEAVLMKVGDTGRRTRRENEKLSQLGQIMIRPNRHFPRFLRPDCSK